MKKNILISGGDERSGAVAEYFRGKNFNVSTEFFSIVTAKDYKEAEEKQLSADYMVLPLPVSSDGIHLNAPYCEKQIQLDGLIAKIDSGTVVFGGMLNRYLKSLFEEKKIKYFDYFDNESLQIRNAVPTAEGAVSIMMDKLPVTVNGSDSVITGYGRIGKALSMRLHLLGSNVTVCARNPSELATAEGIGMNTLLLKDLLKKPIKCDVIFNTIPCNIFDSAFLTNLDKNTLVIDLASKPYGCEASLISQWGGKYIIASSLPGKTSPQTAGRIIAATVFEIINKENT